MKPQELAAAVNEALKDSGATVTLENMTWAGLLPANMTWAGKITKKPVTLILTLVPKVATGNMTWAGAEEVEEEVEEEDDEAQD